MTQGLELKMLDDVIVFEGLLLAAPPGRVCVVVDALHLELDAADLVDVEELPLPDDAAATGAIAAVVHVTRGARLWSLAPAAAAAPARTTFAMASRPRRSFSIPAAFREKEAAFYRRIGIAP